MNIDTIINKTTEELPYSRDLIAKTIKSYNNYLEKSLSAVQLSEISVPYVGTFILDKVRFFQKLLRTFVFLRKLKNKMFMLEETKGVEHSSYKLAQKRYNELCVEFRKLWAYKQKEGWMFTYSISKRARSRGYFEDSYKQKEARDKKFAKETTT